MILIVSLIALNGCNEEPDCPHCKKTFRISKLDRVAIKVNNKGGLDRGERIKAFTLIKRFRIVEDYYYKNSTEAK